LEEGEEEEEEEEGGFFFFPPDDSWVAVVAELRWCLSKLKQREG